jgi:hypothetical protein
MPLGRCCEIVDFLSSGRYSTASHKSDLRNFAIIFSPPISHLPVDDAGIAREVLLAAEATK